MRLIDADEFRRVLIERQTDVKHYENMELRQEIGEIIEALDKQPIACDIDDIKKHIGACGNSYKNSTDAYEQGKRFAYYNSVFLINSRMEALRETNKETHQST